MTRILLVDDFEDSRFSLCKLLEMEGFEVLEAADGARAVELATSSRPDLILMDLSLPVVDGLSATKQIRNLGGMNEVPIIAISAHDVAEFHKEALDAGCTDYLSKPIDFNLLMNLVSKYLHRPPSATP